MEPASSSSSGTSSPKYEFSDLDDDQKQRGQSSSRPRRLPTSNSKNAVAARMNRMKQKRYVMDLELKMLRLRRELRDVRKELQEGGKKIETCRRKMNFLRSTIANSQQIGSLLRNIHWRNIIAQVERDNIRPMEPPRIRPENEDAWALHNDNNPTTELFQDTVPPKFLPVSTVLP